VNAESKLIFLAQRQSAATGCLTARSDFRVDGWIVMELTTRGGQPVGSHVLLGLRAMGWEVLPGSFCSDAIHMVSDCLRLVHAETCFGGAPDHDARAPQLG